MELFKEILSDLKITFKNWLCANVILLLPTIGMLLSVEFDSFWIFIVCVCVSYIILDFYGCRYHKINNKKDETKLFSSKEECYYTYGLLLGHTFIKDLKAYHYDKLNNKYVQVEL